MSNENRISDDSEEMAMWVIRRNAPHASGARDALAQVMRDCGTRTAFGIRAASPLSGPDRHFMTRALKQRKDAASRSALAWLVSYSGFGSKTVMRWI